MPILQNAKKALRVSKRKTTVNSRVKSVMKTMIDKLKKNPSSDNLSIAYSAIDKAIKSNMVHKNKAARIKAQLSKLVKAGSSETATKVSGKTNLKKVTKKTSPSKVAKKKVDAKKTTTKKATTKKQSTKTKTTKKSK